MNQEAPRPARVLVVEDHPDNRMLACKVLRRAGFEVAELERAEGLSERITHVRPDVILMDIELPGRSGHEAVQLLKADPATAAIPVIALTAYAMPEDREWCLRAGCCDYLSKPLDIVELVAIVRKYIAEK